MSRVAIYGVTGNSTCPPRPIGNCPRNPNEFVECTQGNLVRGSKGDVVAQAQRFLQSIGLYPYQIDGLFTCNLEEAVNRFLLSCGLPPTGIIDASFWNAANQFKKRRWLLALGITLMGVGLIGTGYTLFSRYSLKQKDREDSDRDRDRQEINHSIPPAKVRILSKSGEGKGKKDIQSLSVPLPEERGS